VGGIAAKAISFYSLLKHKMQTNLSDYIDLSSIIMEKEVINFVRKSKINT